MVTSVLIAPGSERVIPLLPNDALRKSVKVVSGRGEVYGCVYIHPHVDGLGRRVARVERGARTHLLNKHWVRVLAFRVA